MAAWYRVKYDVRTYLGRYPRLFFPIIGRLRRRRVSEHWLSPQVFHHDTDVVIEGYPRSGNTFSIAAFYVATDQKLPKLAHHIHVPAQLIQAIRFGKPAIALIREPMDAMASTLVRDPRLGPLQALRAYIQFYQPLIPHIQQLVVAPFETVTNNFGVVIRTLNQKYGTAYPEFDHNEETVQTCFDLIEKRNSMHTGKIAEHKIARPSGERKELAQQAKQRLQHRSYAKLLKRAEYLHQMYSEAAVSCAN